MNPFQDLSILRMEFGLDINSSLTVVPEETLQAEVWTYVTLLSALILPILVLNIIVIVAIWKQRSLRTGSNIFIISLAMADICIALFVIPGHISGQFSEDWVGNMICKVCSYSSFTAEAAAVISLTAISLDRVRSVAFPLKPKPTKQQAGILILGIWVASLLFGLRGAMTFALSHVFVDSHDGIIHTRALCFMNSTDEVTNRSMMALDFVFLFTIPALVVGISYTAILCIASRHMQRMKSTQRDNQNGPGRIKLKAVRMSVMVISIFVVLHLPDHVLMMYASRDGALIPNSMTIIRVFHLVAFLNSVLNPIFYGFLNPKIRVGLKKLFKRRSDLNESCCCCSWCSIWKSQSRSSGSSGSSQWQMFKHKLGAKKDSSGSKETQIVHLDGCEEPKEELNQHHKKPLNTTNIFLDADAIQCKSIGQIRSAGMNAYI